MMDFQLISEFSPTGDQPAAIEEMVKSINNNNKFQTLLGVTGSGKTFTMANIIKRTKKPTLIKERLYICSEANRYYAPITPN